MLVKKAATVVAGLVMALGAASPAIADAGAIGAAVGSPGVLSGNVVQVPIHAQINACGNSVNVIGLVNPTVGNVCVNA
ncbi:chaplin [Streptomyces sp. NPDC048604]|uniref:chaplin n=1 Tax=Streptomyces sp. NPDC048604 TaxID=3365578 RepID=UPI0037139B88